MLPTLILVSPCLSNIAYKFLSCVVGWREGSSVCVIELRVYVQYFWKTGLAIETLLECYLQLLYC